MLVGLRSKATRIVVKKGESNCIRLLIHPDPIVAQRIDALIQIISGRRRAETFRLESIRASIRLRADGSFCISRAIQIGSPGCRCIRGLIQKETLDGKAAGMQGNTRKPVCNQGLGIRRSPEERKVLHSAHTDGHGFAYGPLADAFLRGESRNSYHYAKDLGICRSVYRVGGSGREKNGVARRERVFAAVVRHHSSLAREQEIKGV